MENDKPSFFLLIIVFLILLTVPVYWLTLSRPHEGISWLDGRPLADFSSLVHRGFLTSLRELLKGDPGVAIQVVSEQLIQRKFQQDLEKVLSDQFPLRLALIKAVKAIDRGVIQLVYCFLSDPAIPADRTSGYYVTRDPAAILVGPEAFTPDTLEIIDRRIQNYQFLINQHPEIHFHVYYIERIQNVSAHPLDPYFDDLERGQSFAYFFENKPVLLVVEKFSVDQFADHLQYFFRTDHHWNVHGVIKAYDDIYGLLATNNPEISEKRTFGDFITFKDIRFRGSSARKAYYPIWEPFTVVNFDLPSYKVVENGKEITYGQSAQYLVGEYPQDTYYNHYEGYYGGDHALLEFVFENSSDRNLLVLGSSYNNALMPLLASHYHHTYDVDLRYYTDFSLSAFLEAYPVDDILVIGENSIVFGSNRYRIQP